MISRIVCGLTVVRSGQDKESGVPGIALRLRRTLCEGLLHARDRTHGKGKRERETRRRDA